ncbi:MAG: exo-alpha-sialidase [Euryarchaeota archaeon]|nr:exo-alpha-sialidase [Euryarchaeota archaeon]
MWPGFLDTKRKKLFALTSVAVLLAVSLSLLLRPGGPFVPPPPPPGKAYPIPPENFAVTTKPSDNNEPTICISTVDPDTMVAGSNDYNTPNGDAWCGFYTTHDRGLTWSEELIGGYPGGPVNQLTGFKGGGDPVIVCDSGGNFYYAGIAFKRAVNPLNPIGFGITAGIANCVFVARSSDNGESFPQVVMVWAALESLVRFNDKEWIAVDPLNGNVYLVWAIFTVMLTARLMFSRSTDGGLSWSRPITITETSAAEFNIQGAAIVVDNESVIHVTWMGYGTNTVRYARSADRGQSFSTPVDVAPMRPIPSPLPNCNYRTPDMTALAVDRSGRNTTGSLYVTWADYSEGDADVLLMYSRDGGGTWDGPVRVNNDTVGNGIDQFFPAVAVSAEGWVHVGFYDRRSDPGNRMLEYWWAISFDGGETFPVNIPMSNASFDGDWSREGTNDFIGDYTGIVADNRTVAAVWCDTREGSESVADSEIYAAIVPYIELLRTNRFENVTIPWP